MIKCLNAIRINPYCKLIDVLPYNANCTYVHASWSNYKKLKLINFLFDDDIKPVILKLAYKHFNRHDMISDYWLQSFFTTLEVSNFPMRKRSVAAEKQLQVVTTRRKIELADIAVSFYHLHSLIKKNINFCIQFLVCILNSVNFEIFWLKYNLFFECLAHPIYAYWDDKKKCMENAQIFD